MSTSYEQTMSIRKNTVDIAIIGGGIAGLWTLARLRKAGYQAILLEAESLGCVQSGASQGIIHGGTKYALTGKLTHSSQSIQAMPQRWKDCLEGHGEIDLRQAKKLSSHQYLWSNKSLAAKITGFFASKVMHSRMQHLEAKNYVPPFQHPDFTGELYQLDESVLDIQSVIEVIREQFAEFIFQANISGISELKHSDDSVHSSRYQLISADHHDRLSVRAVVLTAGSNNEKLLESLQFKEPEMQLRPLLMPMLKAKKSVLPMMYAHCLGASALPKMTITAHKISAEEDMLVWYLGGEIAEKGVGRSIEKQVLEAKAELKTLMPWMDFSTCQWSALAVDRAEPKMFDGSRPVEPAVFKQQNIISAWPVKLAMAPLMVDKILSELTQTGIEKNSDAIALTGFSLAQTAALPWEKVKNWL